MSTPSIARSASTSSSTTAIAKGSTAISRKITYSPPVLNSKSQSTINDILRAIIDLRISQNEVMCQNKMLGEELKSCLDSLTSYFDVPSGEISDLRTNFATLNIRVCNLESTISASYPSTSISNIIQEISERDKCKFNIIVHGLPKSASLDLSTRVCDDKIQLLSEFSKLSIIPLILNPFV